MAERTLLAVLAHPDDESLGLGGTFAKYAAEGVATHLVTATLGERGRIGRERPGAAVVGPVRELELRCASSVLGIREVHLLGYLDGELARVDAVEAAARLAAILRRVRPHVVVTFGADGAYGHPDHVAVSQWTAAAIVEAAAAGDSPHRVDKFYWTVTTAARWSIYEAAFGELVTRVDGRERRAVPWPDWAVTTVVDTRAHWQTVWRAVQCHPSQLSGYERLAAYPAEGHPELWGVQSFYRVFSRVKVAAEQESDLFAGIPGETAPA